MNDVRKKVIIQEISYWKSNRLLPEQYCDYLLALYSGGEESISEKKSFFSIEKSLYALIAVVFIAALFLNYFTQLSNVLQILLLIFSLCCMLGLSFLLHKRKLYYQIPVICSAFILTLLIIQIAGYFAPGHPGILLFLLLCNCLIWFVTGRKLSLIYLWLAGIAGIVVILYVIVR